jgi:hypothetical protein
MQKRIVRAALLARFLLAALYLGVSYAVYDKLSRVTAGGGENAGNTPCFLRQHI